MARRDHSTHSYSNLSSVYLDVHRNRFRDFWEDIEIPLLIILGIFSTILGTIGYQRYFYGHNEIYNIGRSLYSALELLDLMGGSMPPPIPWELEVARWLSPAVTFYAVLRGLTAIFQNQLRVLRLKFTSGHVVICGLGQKGLLLAKNFRALGKTVVVIDNNGNNPLIPACRELGGIVLLGDARDDLILGKAGVARADMLIGVCKDDGTNADIALKGRQLVLNRKGGKLNCCIHIKDPRIWIPLRKQEFSTGIQGAFRLDIFNIYDHGARQLLNEYAITSASERPIQKPPHLLVFGLGNLGTQLVLHASRKWYPNFESSGKKLLISVVDPEADCKIKALCQESSLVRTVCEWKPYPIKLDSPECYQAKFLDDKKKKIDVSIVYICTEDDNIGLSTALSFLEHSSAVNLRILVCLSEDAGLASMLRVIKGMGGLFTNLHVFGILEQVCRPGLLNDGSHESVARAIHGEYIRHETLKGNTPETNPNMVDWDLLAEEIKETNRQQADEIGMKLFAIGCDIIPWTEERADKFTFGQDEIELMAKMEHERWCKQKMDQGWTFGPLRNEKIKEHPSLIAWDDPRFSELEKDKDRDTVRQIPKYLALAGFQVFRVFLRKPTN